MIYLISNDGYKDSIDLESYFTTTEEIEKYIIDYEKDMFNNKVKNITVDFEELEIEFECIWYGYSDDEWEKGKMYLHKVKKYE